MSFTISSLFYMKVNCLRKYEPLTLIWILNNVKIKTFSVSIDFVEYYEMHKYFMFTQFVVMTSVKKLNYFLHIFYKRGINFSRYVYILTMAKC